MNKLIAITIDYETWHPVPEGKDINWEKDIFEPAERLLDLCDQQRVKITFMAEMGEYFWLKQNLPQAAARMERQWIEAVGRGHDVQLHLHPNWLPETGARFENGVWQWDWTKAKCTDYPGDLRALIGKCKSSLEDVLRPVNSGYRVTSFRAGAYRVQPFKELYDALTFNGIFCDSSVYSGGYSRERGYDFTMAYSMHQPYFANPYDPQLKAAPSETKLVEIPIFAFGSSQRWMSDGSETSRYADRLLTYLGARQRPSRFPGLGKVLVQAKNLLGAAYFSFRDFHRWLNKLMPRRVAYLMTSYRGERLVERDYFVSIGHTKGEHDFNALARNLKKLRDRGVFDFITLSQMAYTAKQELLAQARPNATEEAEYQVRRESAAVMGDIRNEAQSHHLQDMIPLDRARVLDLGCGAGYWSHRIASLYPWMRVTGVDYGADFITKAQLSYSSPRLFFSREDFSSLSFPDGAFDCIYADNTLEHAYDVDKTLAEAYRVLAVNGVLVAAIPSDGRNPGRICDNHVWKTAPHEVLMRLENAGFVNVEINEVDAFRQLGMPPYPPSKDSMMYVRAWKRRHSSMMIDRACEAMQWVYEHLDPEKPQVSHDPVQILAGGHAWCLGYSIVLGRLLQREGFSVKWATMLACDHPAGRGSRKIDSHEVLLLRTEGREVILDPMTNTCIRSSLQEVLDTPSKATVKSGPDARYRSRNYEWYDTQFWYSRVFKYTIRSEVNRPVLIWKKAGRNSCS